MARTKKGTPPTYPSKPHKGLARITVRLANGKRHGLYLGPFGSEASRTEYRRVLAELEANGGYYPAKKTGKAGSDLTFSELALLFWQHAEAHYRLTDGSPSRELQHFEYALRPVLALYGDKPAAEFGPQALKAVRQSMIDKKKYFVRFSEGDRQWDRWVPEAGIRLTGGPTNKCQAEWQGKWLPAELLKAKKALSRKVINQRIDHVKRVFGWAVSAELIPSSAHDALLRVRGLRRGHDGTFDHPKVKPVPDEHVEATLPFLSPQVAAMVQVQRLIGARETEICLMQGRNIIDRDRQVWHYVIDPNEKVQEEE